MQTELPAATVRGLMRYPVKGLSGEALSRAELRAGEGIALDRMFGFARHGSGFDPDRPEPMPKSRFLMLMRDEKLASLETSFEPEGWTLRIGAEGSTLVEAAMRDPAGRRKAETFLADFLDLPRTQLPQFVHAAPHRFTDVSVVSKEMMNAVSLINLDSVRAFGEMIGANVDPARFRANIVFDGWPPFSELELVGREIRLGSARARITVRTTRCAATEVNPRTARRDIKVPKALLQNYGHMDMGVYAEILEGGTIGSGASISLVD